MKVRRQPGSKNYFVDFYIDGHRRRVSMRTTDRRTAMLRGRQLLREQIPGERPEKIRLKDFEQVYTKWAETRKSKNTVRVERSVLKRLIAWRGDLVLEHLSTKDADSYITHLATVPLNKEGDPIQPASINLHIRTLRSILGNAKRWNYVSENVFKNISLLRFELPKPRVLTVEEVRAFRTKLREEYPHLVPLIEFYLLTGVRRNEGLGLRWPEVDFERNIIEIRRTKGKRPRIIPIVGRIQKILRARRELPSPFPYQGDFITRMVTDAFQKAGVQNASLHDLRRSFASYLADAGMPDMLLIPTVGHKDRETTQDYYISPFTDTIRGYISKVEETLFAD